MSNDIYQISARIKNAAAVNNHAFLLKELLCVTCLPMS